MKTITHTHIREEIGRTWFTEDQRYVLDLLAERSGKELKDIMIQQTLEWARRNTDRYDTDEDTELNTELRKKLGKEWDY